MRLHIFQFAPTTNPCNFYCVFFFIPFVCVCLDVDESKEPPKQHYDMTPRPIQIVLANEDHTFSLDEDALAEILIRDDIKDRNVVVVSVAGAFRKGKSFLLDFFLRYLNCKVTRRFYTIYIISLCESLLIVL